MEFIKRFNPPSLHLTDQIIFVEQSKSSFDVAKNKTHTTFNINLLRQKTLIKKCLKTQNNENYINIKLSKPKESIYSVGIVKEITDMYQLDFSSRISITFLDVEYIDY